MPKFPLPSVASLATDCGKQAPALTPPLWRRLGGGQIFGGIALMAIAVSVALNVSLVNNKADKESLLALANVEALADNKTLKDDTSTSGKGTLYGNASGTRYCCCPGSNDCSASSCSSSVCD